MKEELVRLKSKRVKRKVTKTDTFKTALKTMLIRLAQTGTIKSSGEVFEALFEISGDATFEIDFEKVRTNSELLKSYGVQVW